MSRRVRIDNPNQLFLFQELVRVPSGSPDRVVFERREVTVRQGLTPKEFGVAMVQVCGRAFAGRTVLDWVQAGVIPPDMVFQVRPNSPVMIDFRAIEHVRKRFRNS